MNLQPTTRGKHRPSLLRLTGILPWVILGFSFSLTVRYISQANGWDRSPAGMLAQLALGGLIVAAVWLRATRVLAQDGLPRLLSERSGEILLLVSADGRILEANPAAARAYGYDRAELVAMSVEALTGVPLQGLSALLEQSGTGEPVAWETYHRRRTGEQFPVEVSLTAMAAGGRPVALAMVRDITQRKELEMMQTLLHEVDRRVSEEQSAETVLAFTCLELTGLFGCESVLAALRGPEGRWRVVATATSAPATEGAGEGWWPAAGQERLSQALDDGDPSALQELLGGRQLHIIPMGPQVPRVGALLITAGEGRGCGEAQKVHLTEFAGQLAQSVVTAERQARMRQQHAALVSAANSILITGRNGVIEWVNPAFTALTGYAPEEAIGRTPRILKSGVHGGEFYRELWETIRAGMTWRSEVCNRRKDGSLFFSELTITPVRNDAGEVVSFVGIQQDITERKQQEDQVRHLAMHDMLTDLPNRRVLHERLDEATGRCTAERTGALLIVDLDHFKMLNDTLGHMAGDRLLVNLARLMQREVPQDGLLCRMGGDEFAVLLPQASAAEATQVGERLRQAVRAFQFSAQGYLFEMGLSVGVAIINGSMDSQAVVALADAALFSAKDHGKNRVEVLHPADERGVRLVEQSRWATRIQDALRQDRYVLHFQPIIRMKTQQPIFYEALVRLRDDKGGLVQPGVFLPVAERFSLMPEIDRWVIQRAIRTLQERPGLKLFVNLSGFSLGDEVLVAFIEERIRQSGIEAGRLSFEITENAVITDLHRARRWMTRLREVGCQFALDDFGTGFSTYLYLSHLPIDYVKIDGSFIRSLETNRVSRAIARAINHVARTMRREVIAESVEEASIMQSLREMGVEYGQGFYWGKPSENLRAESRR